LLDGACFRLEWFRQAHHVVVPLMHFPLCLPALFVSSCARCVDFVFRRPE
jgi:hypothetical protein